MITLHIPGPAVGKAMKTNPKTMGRYKTPQTKAFMKLVADIAFINRPPEPWTGPISVEMEITRRPLQTSQKRTQAMLAGRILPVTKPDNDNVEKAVFDAMSGIIYVDDAQIVRNVTTKQFGAREGITIVVSRWARGAQW